ncbi:hypothetical protein JSY36_03195 [Bacillus sp. H-16]|uniref:hypothetical protein n=1 Tax=Alteribacter salitolerans TaxID=2912333 RepID=UPI001963D044|nr:hypothetical protein [Alteribacter salitolerans]MBM7094753.1 hypothetical protein [Alteribacter salitolerans]
MTNVASRKLAFFEGMKVTEIKKNIPHPLLISLSTGGLSVECPWRLMNGGKIVLGQTDFFHQDQKEFNRGILDKALRDKTIRRVEWLDDCYLLRIVFSENYVMDLFHDSGSQEGWELFGNGDFSFISLPGGEPEMIEKDEQ